jgi:hypothetical protein
VTTTLQLTRSSWMVLDKTLWQPPLGAVQGAQWYIIGVMLTASSELVGDLRMGRAIGPRSRYTFQIFVLLFSLSARRFPVWKRRTLLLYMFE